MNIVRVHWVDSHNITPYWLHEIPPLPGWCVSVGYDGGFLGGFLSLIQGVGSDDQINGLLQIPLGAIQFIEEFKTARRRRR